MRAILKPFFALCGLVALSTALSADSRLFPVGGGGAGWGEPGFLYSDYLQTAAASGREVEFQGSFVLDNRRPFLAELGTAFPGRVVDEVKSLPCASGVWAMFLKSGVPRINGRFWSAAGVWPTGWPKKP